MAKQFLNRDQDYAGERIQGKRKHQEDDFGFDNRRADDFLMILADGMGGHQGGAVASSCAVKTFMDTYHTALGTVAERLSQALDKSNEQIAKEFLKKPKLKGMGCTLVGVAISEEQMEWISVGDSPLWLYSAGQTTRLNADHSMKPLLQKDVKAGNLTPKEAAKHPERNMLRSAIVGADIELIDQPSNPLELYPGDRILLASDGIFTLSEAEISRILAKSSPAKDLVNQLLTAVEKKNKRAQDNTTVLVVEIPDKLKAAKKAKLKRWGISILVFVLILGLILAANFQFQWIELSKLFP